ncbi:unnamed protein product, partial [Meganyctiphanes norvegica]
MDLHGELLKRLCSHVTGLNEAQLGSHIQYARSIISNAAGNAVQDETILVDRIKRHLVREKRLEDAARFAGLVIKLQKSTVLHKRSSILSLFLSLSQKPGDPSPSPRNGYVNGHHNDEMFPVPCKVYTKMGDLQPLGTNGVHHSPTSNHSGTPASNFSSDKSSPDPISAGGNVPRLIAMYKGSKYDQARHDAPDSNRGGLRPPDRSHSSSPSQHHKHLRDGTSGVPEETLVKEVLYIFQGIEGKMIKYDESKNMYRIDQKVYLSSSKRTLLLKLAEVGWLYNKVQYFCDANSSSNTAGSGRGIGERISSSGLVNQSLVLALKNQLNEFGRLIAVLEAQVKDCGGTSPGGAEITGGLTLRHLLLSTVDPRGSLQVLAMLTEAASGRQGGEVLSAMYQHLHHGDPAHHALVQDCLTLATRPIHIMLNHWLLDGTLNDPHHEFFIASDHTVPDDKLWQDKYSIRWTMLPSFIKPNQALRILATGKSLNFLRVVCQYRAPIAAREAIKDLLQKTTVESLFAQNVSNAIGELVNLTFRETAGHVLEEIRTRHHLLEHLRALRRYLLLGQGDFIHYLMEILEPELAKPAANLYPHNLSSLLETAVAASNAQYESSDILQRLDVRILETSPGDKGWDVFSLDYHVDGPIGTVITAECMRQYLILFNALWRDKHMERILSDMWKQQMATSKLCRHIPVLQGVLHSVHLLSNEMLHLVQQMAYYMTFEVLECSWHSLMSRLETAQSLDDIIAAHNDFLNKVFAGALLDQNSQDVRTHLRTLYTLMMQLQALQERLYNRVTAELEKRSQEHSEIKTRTEAGQFGTSSEVQDKKRKGQKEFSGFVSAIKIELKNMTTTYQGMVHRFLYLLSQHEGDELHQLSVRLDFNEHYHRRDHRLNQHRTYHHKRKSFGGA